MPTLETARLLIRTWTTDESDVADFYAIYGDPEVSRFLFSNQYLATIANARVALAEEVAEFDPMATTGSWAIVERASKRAIGTAIFKSIVMNGAEGIEIGYHLARAAWGNGYATEVTRGLIAYGFDQLDLRRIIGFARQEHAASLRVLEKAGMTRAGTGEFRNQPVIVYAIEQ